MYRNSRSQMFFKIIFLKNFAIFTGKHLCWSLCLIKLQTWGCFPVNIAKFLRTSFFYRTPPVAASLSNSSQCSNFNPPWNPLLSMFSSILQSLLAEAHLVREGWEKNTEIFPYGVFLLCVVDKSLCKCLFS